MKFKWLFLWLTALFSSQLFGQDFTGFVKTNDSLPVVLYHANIDIIQNGLAVNNVKSYFDGSFRFTTGKNQSYSLHITYPGYTDTTFTVTTDKKGNPSPDSVTVRLRKDGMRLLGVVKGADNVFPIKNVTLIVKNVMTRKEERQTTGVDGYFNFKLEYETNYRISIDKRSLGVFHKYRDTAFYISTVGFNMPVDYRLDIVLDPEPDPGVEMPDGYDASKVSTDRPLKPVIQVNGANGKPVVPVAAAKVHPVYSTAKALDEQKKLKPAKGGVTKPAPASKPAASTYSLNPEQKNPAYIAAKKAADDSIARHRAEQTRINKELARKKAVEDSIERARPKALQDSIAKVQAENRRIAQKVVAEMMRHDSIAKALQSKKLLPDSAKQAKPAQ